MIFCFPKMSFCWNCKSRILLLYTVYHQLCLVLYAIMYNYIVLAYYIFILLTWFMLRIDNIEIINLQSWFYFLSHNNVKVNLYSYLEGSFFSNLGNWLTPYTLTHVLEICLRWLWLMKWPLKSRWCYCWCWSWCFGFMFFSLRDLSLSFQSNLCPSFQILYCLYLNTRAILQWYG